MVVATCHVPVAGALQRYQTVASYGQSCGVGSPYWTVAPARSPETLPLAPPIGAASWKWSFGGDSIRPTLTSTWPVAPFLPSTAM